MTALHIPGGPLSIVAVGAHPDDIEIGCGGTLLSLTSRPGTVIRSIVLTATAERAQEAIAAARAFGAKPPAVVGLPDARLPAHWETVKDELLRFRGSVPVPDIVLAPRVDDAHQDHRLLGTMVSTVWRGPLILRYEIPKWDGDLGRPNLFVPLTAETVAKKIELLNTSFPSQHDRQWWDPEFFRSLLRIRGAEAQTRYAEAFHVDKITVSWR